MGIPKGETWAYEEMMKGENSGWIGFGVANTERVQGATSTKQVFATAKVAK